MNLPHSAENIPKLDKVELLQTCKDYGLYLHFPELAKNKVQGFEGTVENGLMRIDEFSGLLEAIRSDGEKTRTKIIPLLDEKSKQLQRVFSLIDQLETFVNHMGTTVKAMEDQIADTEYNYNLVQRQRTMNSFGLGGLTSKYIPVKTRTTMPEYKGLRIVDTQTFFSNFKRGGAPEEAAPQDESAQPKAKPN